MLLYLEVLISYQYFWLQKCHGHKQVSCPILHTSLRLGVCWIKFPSFIALFPGRLVRRTTWRWRRPSPCRRPSLEGRTPQRWRHLHGLGAVL